MVFSIPVSAGVAPAANTDTTLFTSTGDTSALVTVANRSTAELTYRIAHQRGGSTLDNTMYKVYDFTLLGNEDRIHGPLFLSNAAIVTVRANSTAATFTLEGLSTG